MKQVNSFVSQKAHTNKKKYNWPSSRTIFLIPLLATEILSVFENSAMGQSSQSPANAQSLSTIAPLSSFSYTRFSSGDSVSSSLINANFDEIFYELNAILTTGILGATSLNFTTTGGGGITLAPAGTGGINLSAGTNAGVSLTANGTGNIILTAGATGDTTGNVQITTPATDSTTGPNTLQVSGSLASNAVSYSSSTVNLGSTDSVALVSASSASVTVNLPTPGTTNAGRQYTIKRTDSSANTVLVNVTGGSTIDGISNVYLPTQYAFITVVSNGSLWSVINFYAAPTIAYA
jgi:hypothetical protein